MKHSSVKRSTRGETLQQLCEVCTHSSTPAIWRIHISSFVKKENDYFCAPFAWCQVKCCPLVIVSQVSTYAFHEFLHYTSFVTFAWTEKKAIRTSPLVPLRWHQLLVNRGKKWAIRRSRKVSKAKYFWESSKKTVIPNDCHRYEEWDHTMRFINFAQKADEGPHHQTNTLTNIEMAWFNTIFDSDHPCIHSFWYHHIHIASYTRSSKVLKTSKVYLP